MSSRTENKKRMKDAVSAASSEMFQSQQNGKSSSFGDSRQSSASSMSSQRPETGSSRDTDSTMRASGDSKTSGRSSFSPTKIMMERGLLGNKGYDLREHLQHIMKLSDSEYSSDDYSVESYEEESDGAEEELKHLVGKSDQPPTPKPTDQQMTMSNALVPIEEDEDLDSEEENEIMKEIKEEIKNQVREEMKSELDLYQAKKEKLERGAQQSDSKGGISEDLENLEPKLRDAFIKMRKLDKILAKRVRREKDVKRDRILLERRIRTEIEQIHKEGGDKYKEVTSNTEKFLALELPPRHNEETFVQGDTSSNTDNICVTVCNSSLDKKYDLNGTTCIDTVETNNGCICKLEKEEINGVSSEDITAEIDNHAEDDRLSGGSKNSHSCNVAQRVESGRLEVKNVSSNDLELGLECTTMESSCSWDVGFDSGIMESLDLTGVVLPEDFPQEPVFRTQLNENEYPEYNENRHRRRKGGSRAGKEESENQEAGSEGEETSSTASGKERKHRRKHKKDFIKRNKELAADADNVIAMTEEEKKRLEDLLKDVETIPELPEESEDTVEGADNPYQIAVRPGEGYQPDQEDLRSLTSIDARLKDIMLPEDFESISSSSMSHLPQHKLFTRTGVKSSMEIDKPGESVLLQTKEDRNMGERLKAIEEELAKLHNPEELEIETPRLEEDQLHELIDQCVTSLSRVSMSRTSMTTDANTSRTSFTDMDSKADNIIDTGNTPRSPRSARQEILDNPPHLAPDVLQKLLSEAYCPMSSHLSTLQEEENEDDGSTPIPAEVWKLIALENVDKDTGDSVKGDNSSCSEKSDLRNLKGNSQDNTEKRSRINGQRNLSRMSSQSSLDNGANSDSGRDSVHSGRSSGLSGRDSKTPFLPNIDPSGTLITQGLNNQFSQRSSSSSSMRTPIPMLRNSFTDSRTDNSDSDKMEVMSFDGDFSTPRPPTGEKRQTSSKSRIVTPVNK